MLGRICLVLASRREIDRIYEDLGRTSPFQNRFKLEVLGLAGPESPAAGTACGGGDLLHNGQAAIPLSATVGHYRCRARLTVGARSNQTAGCGTGVLERRS